ncbi:hypothetical protein GCM10009716_18990 [Streptomyces sodiiphilus]|uniref:LysM domain-containing protein n=1 Tax=Streptomyces sodiiphilus TaxID=226217 RepID=A0ABP5AD84_9ACTN
MPALRSLLALVLVTGFHLVSWLLVLGYATVSLLVIALYLDGGVRVPSPVPLFFVAFGAPAALAIVRGLLAGSGRPLPEPGSVPVGREQAPELWETVTALAGRVGTPAPTEIRLTMEANAAVSEDVRAGLRVARRRLYIGVPLLAALRADEMRAVLCHELGHYSRRHTRFGATVYRGSVTLHRVVDGIAEAGSGNALVAMYSGVQRFTLRTYARLYDVVSLAVRRRQELEADATAAAVAGREATASALTTAQLTGLAWEDFRVRFLVPMAESGRLPDDPLRAFGAMVTDPEYGKLLDRLERGLPGRRASLLDSHPPLGRRLAALERRAADGAPVRRDSAPASVLMGPAQRLPESVHRRLSGWTAAGPAPAGRERVPWSDWLDDAAALQVERAVEELGGTAAALGGSAPTLDGVLGLLEDGRGRELSSALRTTGWGEPQWGDLGARRTRVAVRMLVGQGLVAAGRAGWKVSWTGPCGLVTFDEDSAEAVRLAVAAVEDPSVVPDLRFRLALCGVRLDLPTAGTDRPARAPGAPERSGTRPGGKEHGGKEPRHPVQAGWIAVLLLIGAVFLWSYYGTDDRPEPPVAGRQVLPAPGGEAAEGGTEGAAERPAPPERLPADVLPEVSPVEECGPGRLPLGGDCVPLAGIRLPGAGDQPAVPPGYSVTVESGDTLFGLACRHLTTVEELIEVNGLESTELRVGQKLTVPGLPLKYTGPCP